MRLAARDSRVIHLNDTVELKLGKMQKKSIADQPFDFGVIDEGLSRLISEWEILQKKIETLSFEECKQDASKPEVEWDLEEEHLQFQQSRTMKLIAERQCVTIADKLAKLEFWQRCKRLKSLSINQFSLTDQIGLSIEI